MVRYLHSGGHSKLMRYRFGEQHGSDTHALQKRVFTNLNGDFVMAHQGTSLQEAKQYEKYHENSLKHWRAWGSWFSWGSPVGLGLFLISLAFCVWLLGQTFGWS